MWELLQFLLNAFLFILIGLQLPQILDGLEDESMATLIGYGARGLAPRSCSPAWSGRTPLCSSSARSTAARASAPGARAGGCARSTPGPGMRGAVSLAAALALRERLPPPRPDPLPDLRGHLRHARAPGPDAAAADPRARRRRRRHRRRSTRSSRRGCSRRRPRWPGSTSSRARTGPATTRSSACAALYEYRRRRLKARAGKIEDDGYEDRSVAYQTIVREVLEAQRARDRAPTQRGHDLQRAHAPARA